MVAISVREALCDAIAAFGEGRVVELESPATRERVYPAIQCAKDVSAPRGEPLAAGAIRE
jgi:xanthine dehydrogenase large subunit